MSDAIAQAHATYVQSCLFSYCTLPVIYGKVKATLLSVPYTEKYSYALLVCFADADTMVTKINYPFLSVVL